MYCLFHLKERWRNVDPCLEVTPLCAEEMVVLDLSVILVGSENILL